MFRKLQPLTPITTSNNSDTSTQNQFNFSEKSRNIDSISTTNVAKPTITKIPVSVSSYSALTRITRNGTKLFLGSVPFRFSGGNVFWLGIDYDEFGRNTNPNHRRIEEAFALSASMNATVIRSHTLGINFKVPAAAIPEIGQNNASGWDSIDFSFLMARKYNIRLIAPMTDFHGYFHGGMLNFNSSKADFYKNPTKFLSYIEQWMNHTNTYTGVKLGQDPILLCIETGNELGAWRGSEGFPPASWVQVVANKIKSINPEMLVMNGTDGVDPKTPPEIDIVTAHAYPRQVEWIRQNASAAQKLGRPLYIGEYAAVGSDQKESLDSVLSEFENNPNICGDSFWSLFGRNSDGSRVVRHHDAPNVSYSIYPTEPDQKDVVQKLKLHASKMSGAPLSSMDPMKVSK